MGDFLCDKLKGYLFLQTTSRTDNYVENYVSWHTLMEELVHGSPHCPQDILLLSLFLDIKYTFPQRANTHTSGWGIIHHHRCRHHKQPRSLQSPEEVRSWLQYIQERHFTYYSHLLYTGTRRGGEGSDPHLFVVYSDKLPSCMADNRLPYSLLN